MIKNRATIKKYAQLKSNLKISISDAQNDIYYLLQDIAKELEPKIEGLDIDICSQGRGCYSNLSDNYIFLAFSYIIDSIKAKEEDYKKRSHCNNIIDITIWILYHEFAHILDGSKRPDRFEQEIANMDIGRYKASSEYHNSRPFEKRADRFARLKIRELKKQVKKEVVYA